MATAPCTCCLGCGVHDLCFMLIAPGGPRTKPCTACDGTGRVPRGKDQAVG